MTEINCAIIEDEPLGAKSLEELLKKRHPEIKVIAFAKTLEEAAGLFNKPGITLYFTDIELQDGNIFDILNKIMLDKGKYLVFTTAYEEFGVKAFSYPALHYLMKPINPQELDKAIDRFREITGGGKMASADGSNEAKGEFLLNKIILSTQNGTSFIDINSIIRVQSANKYSIVFTTDKKQHIVTKPLTRFEEVLGNKGFLRVHDSHLVNVHHINNYVKGKGGELIMSDNSEVPVSQRRKEALSAILKNIL
ncbi:MAG TPA: LytTR family DNA-binding domain-containing protein [Chitinophagales bacterium]|nr:LytTR family DNA-binding domain-containing protein [Chitinophagales bacterium]